MGNLVRKWRLQDGNVTTCIWREARFSETQEHGETGFIRYYSGIPLIRINWEDEPYEYAVKIRIIGYLFENRLHW